MGSSESKARIDNTTNKVIINKNAVDILNQSTNDLVVNTVIKSAQNCTAKTIGNQTIKLKGIAVSGDFTYDSTQLQDVAVDFSCIKINEIKNEISQNVIEDLMAKLTSNLSTDVLSQMNADAQTYAQKSNLLEWGDASASSDIRQRLDERSVTETYQNLKNIVSLTVQNNFNSEDVQNCVNEIAQNQEVELQGINVGGNATFKIGQQQAILSVTKCISQQNFGQKITSDLTKKLNLEVETTQDTKSESAQESTATATAGGSLAMSTASYGSLTGASGGGIVITIAVISVLCICISLIFAIIGVVIYIMNRKKMK